MGTPQWNASGNYRVFGRREYLYGHRDRPKAGVVVRLRVPPPSGLDLLASRHGTKMLPYYVCPASRSLQSGAEIDLLHQRVGLDLVTEAVSDNLPVMQDRDPVGQLERDVHIVLDDQQGHGGIELF